MGFFYIDICQFLCVHRLENIQQVISFDYLCITIYLFYIEEGFVFLLIFFIIHDCTHVLCVCLCVRSACVMYYHHMYDSLTN